MAERFYSADLPQTGDGQLSLVGDEALHLARVRRVEVGTVVIVFDGGGLAIEAEVVAITKSRVDLRRVGEPLPDRVPPLAVTLATAAPKGERLDWLVEKATELGVARLVLLLTERTVVDPGPGKLERLRRIVIEASKQSGRNRFLQLDRPTSWADFLRGHSRDAARYVANPDGRPGDGWPRPGRGGAATVAVGPEGGFTDAEIEAARGLGWAIVGLGPTILRVETAGLAACSRVLALAETDTEHEGWDA